MLFRSTPRLGRGKWSFTSLFLEPPLAAAMRELLAGSVPGLRDAAVGAIVARGSPHASIGGAPEGNTIMP